MCDGSRPICRAVLTPNAGWLRTQPPRHNVVTALVGEASELGGGRPPRRAQRGRAADTIFRLGVRPLESRSAPWAQSILNSRDGRPRSPSDPTRFGSRTRDDSRQDTRHVCPPRKSKETCTLNGAVLMTRHRRARVAIAAASVTTTRLRRRYEAATHPFGSVTGGRV